MNTSIFEKIELRTADHEVTENLRRVIVNGKLEPGDHLNELSIAEQMSVSRVPVREALRKLEQEGLVTRFPNRGCFVVSFSEEDVAEVFSLRAALECMSYEWALPHLTPDDFATLHTMIAQQNQAIREGHFDLLTELDMAFHEFICIKAKHTRLLKNWYAQSAQTRMLMNLRFRILSSYTPETVPSDHSNILDLLEARNLPAAIELTKEISKRVERECIETIHRIEKKESKRTFNS